MHFVLRTALLLLILSASPARGGLLIEGVSDEIERNVRSYVALASEPCDAEAWLVRRRFRKVEAEVRSALEPFGYYDPTIDKTLVLDAECWQAIISIEPGSPVVLRTVDISIVAPATGAADFALFGVRTAG